MIRGKGYNEAVAILMNTPKAASEPCLKCSTARQPTPRSTKGLNRDNLFVAECYADQGPTLKRVQPVSKGRAYRILKRTSHITVVLDERA